MKFKVLVIMGIGDWRLGPIPNPHYYQIILKYIKKFNLYFK